MANRLAAETSPYLRQHADNPVDWYAWRDEAFAEARQRDVPILLSIGYSACHWCHVMAHESFENPATAAVMNELFVNIKVDREERPDVDAIYMDAVQAMTGSGGWPMTVFLDHDARPFLGGTYFPPESSHGMPGFVDLLRAVDDAWRNRRDAVVERSERLTSMIGQMASTEAADLPTADTLTAAQALIGRQFDAERGGFGHAPKFPQSMALDLLLRDIQQPPAGGEPTPGALEIVIVSLDAMASGGIYDHLGGGFARYSVDEEWLVPHFEKMLYDQALLARAYLHAWKVTGAPRFRQVLDETIAYVLRDLRHPEGGFYSAEDADSEGEEGRFYVWTPDEIRAVAGADAEATIAWYGVTDRGNFEGSNILNRIPHRGDLVRPPEVERARAALFSAREERIRPGLDDKVLTEWNALMLATLAEAAQLTGSAAWREAATRTGEFLLSSLRRDDGRWLRSWQEEGGARHLAYAADHAALVDAFSRLAELTGEARWIDAARQTADALLDLFWDDDHGGVFTTGTDAEALLTRPKDLSDNAVPSANSLTAFGLLRLAALTGDERYHDRALGTLRILMSTASQHPVFFAHALAAASLYVGGTSEIVVTGDRPDLVEIASERWLPTAVLAWGERFDSPLWEGRDDGRAYVCRNFACQLPTDDPATLGRQLDDL